MKSDKYEIREAEDIQSEKIDFYQVIIWKIKHCSDALSKCFERPNNKQDLRTTRNVIEALDALIIMYWDKRHTKNVRKIVFEMETYNLDMKEERRPYYTYLLDYFKSILRCLARHGVLPPKESELVM